MQQNKEVHSKKSYQILKNAFFDNSLYIKLHAFVSFAKNVESLAKVHQTNEPVVLFLTGFLGRHLELF